MKYTTIVFDCDGTLLDTLTDLRNAVNYVLRAHDLPERSVPEVKVALGNGVAHLMHQSFRRLNSTPISTNLKHTTANIYRITQPHILACLTY